MSDRELYTPGPAHGAQLKKDGEKWALIQRICATRRKKSGNR